MSPKNFKLKKNETKLKNRPHSFHEESNTHFSFAFLRIKIRVWVSFRVKI